MSGLKKADNYSKAVITQEQVGDVGVFAHVATYLDEGIQVSIMAPTDGELRRYLDLKGLAYDSAGFNKVKVVRSK